MSLDYKNPIKDIFNDYDRLILNDHNQFFEFSIDCFIDHGSDDKYIGHYNPDDYYYIIYEFSNYLNYYNNLSRIEIDEICTHLKFLSNSNINKFNNIIIKFEFDISFNTDGVDTNIFEPSVFFNENELKRIINEIKSLENLNIVVNLMFYEDFKEYYYIKQLENYFDDLFIFNREYGYGRSTHFDKNIFIYKHLKSFDN